MRALWLESGRLTLRDDLPEPEPAPGELTIRVRYAGICGTDMALLQGYSGMQGIPGHEFMGEVIGGPDDWLNARVVAAINIGCGACDSCAMGLPNHCARRKVLGIRDWPGAFAERVAVPAANVFRLPDEITDLQGVLVEPLAAALEILEQVSIGDDTRILVVGAGRLAQLVIQVLADRGPHIDVLVRNDRRRKTIAAPIRCLREDEIAEGSYDLIVECSGSPGGFETALKSVRPRGTIVMKSTYAANLTVDMSRIVVNEINLIGSRCGPFEKAIEWLQDGKIRLSHLEFRVFGLSEFQAAFESAGDPGVYKVIIDPAG